MPKQEELESVTANAPPAKKTKTGKEHYALNVNKAVNANVKDLTLTDLVNGPVTDLAGVGIFSGLALKSLQCGTIKDLGEYKFFKAARAICTLADLEEAGQRESKSLMNVDDMVTEEYHAKSFRDMADAPVHVLQGLSEEVAENLVSKGVQTVRDLANFELCRTAEAMVEASKYEYLLTDKERKVERELKQLS